MSSPILALDLGTSTGYAIRTPAGSTLSGQKSFALKRHDGNGRRFLNFRNWLTQMNGDPFGAIYYEDALHFIGADPARVYFGMLATLQAWAEHRSIPYHGVNVSTLKKFATGKGNAKKPDMIAAARLKFDRPDLKQSDDDEADALHLLDYATNGKI